MIDKEVKKQFGSWTAFSKLQGENHKNFKRKIEQNIERLNKWIEPLGLEIQIALKKQKRAGKNIKTGLPDNVE